MPESHLSIFAPLEFHHVVHRAIGHFACHHFFSGIGALDDALRQVIRHAESAACFFEDVKQRCEPRFRKTCLFCLVA